MAGSFKTAAILLLAVAGCTLANDTPPAIEVMGVQLLGVGLTSQRLAVTLCVTNPNNNDIAFRRVTAGLDVSGLPLAAGSSDLPVQLPAQSSTAVPFTVTATVQNLGPLAEGLNLVSAASDPTPSRCTQPTLAGLPRS